MNGAINLLPPEYLPRRRSLPGRAITAVALGGLLLAVYLVFWVRMGLLSRQVARLEDQLALYQPRAQQAAASQDAMGTWQRKERELQRLVKERRRWQPLLAAINDALPREAWLTRLEENEAKGELVLAGESTSLEAIGNFITALQGSGLWQAVNLQEVKGSDRGLAFTIQAVFKGVPTTAGDRPPRSPAGTAK